MWQVPVHPASFDGRVLIPTWVSQILFWHSSHSTTLTPVKLLHIKAIYWFHLLLTLTSSGSQNLRRRKIFPVSPNWNVVLTIHCTFLRDVPGQADRCVLKFHTSLAWQWETQNFKTHLRVVPSDKRVFEPSPSYYYFNNLTAIPCWLWVLKTHKITASGYLSCKLFPAMAEIGN